MKMKSNTDKGVMDNIYNLTLKFNDNTEIKLNYVQDFDFDIYADEESYIEFTVDEVSKYILNRIGRSAKDVVKCVTAKSKLFNINATNARITEHDMDIRLTGNLKVKNYRLFSTGKNENASMFIRLEGVLN